MAKWGTVKRRQLAGNGCLHSPANGKTAQASQPRPEQPSRLADRSASAAQRIQDAVTWQSTKILASRP